MGLKVQRATIIFSVGLNDNKPWAEMDVADLRLCAEHGIINLQGPPMQTPIA
jgi:hypothetical protein